MKKIISSILILVSIILVGCKKDVKPESIVIGYSDNSVLVGEELTLTISSPTAKANLKVKWAVSDATIATVSGSGVVKGVKVGTVEVTATSTSDATKSDKALIYVIDQVTKEYRAPIVQLLKFSKDENVLTKFGAWRQAYYDDTAVWDAKDNFNDSLAGWIEETKTLLGSSITSKGESPENWLYSIVEYLVYNIDRGISFNYAIKSIDEYKDHFLQNEDVLTEQGYSDIKVIEVYRKITTYDLEEDDFSDSYYFAVGKKNGKLEILEYSINSYFYTALDYVNDYFKGLTITEIEFTELSGSFDYYLEEDNSYWEYYYDRDTAKAYKGFSSLDGVETTRYILVALRIGNYLAGYYDRVNTSYNYKYTTVLSTVVNRTGYSSASYYTTVTDFTFTNQDSFNYYVEKYGSVEIIKFNYPNSTGLTYYYGIVKDGDGYQSVIDEYVIINPVDFLDITLEIYQSYTSFTYSLIAESDIDSSIKSEFNSYKDDLNLTEIVGYKVNYTNQFVTRTRSIYLFKNTKDRYIYTSL